MVLAPFLLNAQLRSNGSQLIGQGTPGVIGAPEADDFFGSSVATGDFNNDGFDDLAVGVSGESVDGEGSAGAVNVLYGGLGGIASAGDQIWSQNTTDVDGEAEADDQLGFALASCDFNGDHFYDLAMGAPGENDGAGSVNVLYGAPGGLEAAGNQTWSQGSPGVIGLEEAGDVVGFALACGDFDWDGFDDLAIGAAGEAVGELGGAGAVNVLYGSAQGLTATGDAIFTQNTDGLASEAEVGDLFGSSLAAGDFDNDGYCDLAIGSSGEDLEPVGSAGVTQILYGGEDGLMGAGSQIFHQDSPLVPDTVEPGDRFGEALTAGDFNNDGFYDLAVSAPGEDFGEVAGVGVVTVLFGRSGGLAAGDAAYLHQDLPRVSDVAELGDGFGGALASGDFDHDGFDDLAIGVSGDDVAGVNNAGLAQVFYGRSFGFSGGGQLWSQESPGIDGEAQVDDRLGNALAVGDFNRDGFSDLVIAASREDSGSVEDTGQVHVLFGGPPADLESDLFRQQRAQRGAAARRRALLGLLP